MATVTNGNSEMRCIPNSRDCNIELAVREDWVRKVDSCAAESLALRFIDGHSEGWAHRELTAAESERQLSIRGGERDAWDENPGANVAARSNLSIDDPVHEALDYKEGAVC